MVWEFPGHHHARYRNTSSDILLVQRPRVNPWAPRASLNQNTSKPRPVLPWLGLVSWVQLGSVMIYISVPLSRVAKKQWNRIRPEWLPKTEINSSMVSITLLQFTVLSIGHLINISSPLIRCTEGLINVDRSTCKGHIKNKESRVSPFLCIGGMMSARQLQLSLVKPKWPKAVGPGVRQNCK